MNPFDTDKITVHNYHPTYLKIAGELGSCARVLELGTWKGESLRMWQSLFPLGEVTGVDVGADAVRPEGVEVVISAQDDPALPGKLHGPFDLIVDDASHEMRPTMGAWNNLWPLLRVGGFYVIEDWWASLLPWTILHKRDDGKHNYAMYGGPGMLKVAEALLMTLDGFTDVEEITYRYGLIIIRKGETVKLNMLLGEVGNNEDQEAGDGDFAVGAAAVDGGNGAGGEESQGHPEV